MGCAFFSARADLSEGLGIGSASAGDHETAVPNTRALPLWPLTADSGFCRFSAGTYGQEAA